MDHTQYCSLRWIIKIVCCSLAAGSEVFSPSPYFIFPGFLSVTTKPAADNTQCSLWRTPEHCCYSCVLWLLWRCHKMSRDNWKTTKTKSKVAIWKERVLDCFPDCFQCFNLPSIVSLYAAIFRIKTMVSILFHGKYFCLLEVKWIHLHYRDFLCNTREWVSKTCWKYCSRGLLTFGIPVLIKMNLQCDKFRQILTLELGI